MNPSAADSPALRSEIRVQYAAPARQIAEVVGSVFIMVAVFVELAFWVKSGWMISAICVVMVGLWFWLLWTQTNTHGHATIDADGIRLVPVRASVCAPWGELNIPWDEIVSVESGWVDGLKPREFVTFRRARSPRSLMVMGCAGEAVGFSEQVILFLNQSRQKKGEPKIQIAEAMSGRGWRLFAGVGLAAFTIMVVFAVMNPEKLTASMIGRLLVTGCFFLALAGKVFSTKRR